MRTGVIDQTLAIAFCPCYELFAPLVSVNIIMNLAQFPLGHPYLVRTEVIENLLKLREKLSNQWPLANKEDSVVFKTLW